MNAGNPGALFAYPFRIFFVSVAVFAVLVVPAWVLLVLGVVAMPTALPPLDWHRHEMVFGLLDAAVAGFLLTAVCTWTSTVRTHGARLAALWGVWFAARLLLAFGDTLPQGWVVVVDLAFLPLVILDAGTRIVRAGQRRHAVVLVVLGLLWLMHLGHHLRADPRFVQGALVMAMTLMLVIGGRITPAFSGNWLRQTGGDAGAIRVYPWLERATLGSMFGLLAATLLQVPAWLMSVTALAACVASASRLVLWQGWRMRCEPLLWILHLGVGWIPLALLLLSASAAGWVPVSAWVHAAGAGAMGTLILGVMSRVALGHTGRLLKLPPGMALAFAAILTAGLLRVATALHGLPWKAGLIAAAAAWSCAFALYLLRYTAMLASPRPDGKPG